MRHLYLYFLKDILKRISFILILSVPVISLLNRTEILTPGGFLKLFWVCVFVSPFLLQLNTGVSSNLSWLLHLPLKRRDVHLVHYALGWTCYFVSALAGVILSFYVAVHYDQVSAHEFLSQFASIPSEFEKFLGGEWRHPTLLAGVLCIFSLLHLICFKYSLARHERIAQSTVFKNWSPKWKIVAVGLTLLAFSCTMEMVRLSTSCYFAAWVLGAYVWATYIASLRLGLSRQSRRKWVLMGGAVAALQIGFLTLLSMVNIRSDNPNLVASSIYFMDFPASTLQQSQLARLIEQSEVRPGSLETLIDYYRKTYTKGGLIRNGDPSAPSFGKVLETKQWVHSLQILARSYDPNTLSGSDLMSVLSKISRITQKGDSGQNSQLSTLTSFMVKIPISDSEEVALLNSKDTQQNQVGLIRAQFYKKREFIEPIRSHLSSYSPNLLPIALSALSVHSGRTIASQQIPSLVTGNLKLNYLAPDCAQTNWEELVSLSAHSENLAKVNACARELAMREGGPKFRFILGEGWIHSANQLTRLKSLKIKTSKVSSQ